MTTPKEILEGKLAQVLRFSTKREAIALEQSADEMDRIQSLNEREIQTHAIDADAKLIRRLKAALSRVTAGEYGICMGCDEPISEKRLAALPWAELCISCQHHSDAQKSDLSVLLLEDSVGA